MKKIQLWAVDEAAGPDPRATPVEELASTETEQRLEELLVRSPELLIGRGALVGRQVPTEGGPLDLVGIDEYGRVTIYELKRGTLTRDAVAQVLDYASDVAAMAPERFARLIEEESGHRGIEPISDFADWYAREYPDADLLGERPRMVLVGLGADERAKRVVNFLAEAGLDIQLLTFHAFSLDGRLVLARQVETVEPSAPRSATTAATKEGNHRALVDWARERGAEGLLEEVASFIESRLPAYKWPGKTAYSFSLQERTEEGRSSLRSYVTLYVHHKKRNALLLAFSERAEAAAPEAMTAFIEAVPSATRASIISKAVPTEAEVTPANWSSISERLDPLLEALVEGWKRMQRDDTD